MNHLLLKLRGADLRSDDHADGVAAAVLGYPSLIDLLVEGLSSQNDVVRARAEHRRRSPELDVIS